MKADTRHRMTMGTRVRFLLRLLGATGLLIALAAGLFLASSLGSVTVDDATHVYKNAIDGTAGQTARIIAFALAGGLALIALLLVVEMLGMLSSGARGRGVTGANSFVQIVLAVGIVAGLNVFAFNHSVDVDLTRAKQFTLPAEVVSELQKLKSETTIVVLQQHKTFGQLSAKPDRFDYAAERKVVEKVIDLVDVFRRFGPQFRVVVLDVEEDGYDAKLAELVKNYKNLGDAVKTAPENSIFFLSEGRVQRMSFNEFYQLDKSRSKQEGNNLVLQPQGITAFVRNIVAVQQKRPRVALAVMHEWLATEVTQGQEQYSQAGLRQSLTEYGFDVVDLVLKANHRGEDLEGDPAALSLEENKLKSAEEDLQGAERRVTNSETQVKRLQTLKTRAEEVKDKPLAARGAVYRDMSRDVVGRQIAGDLDEEDEKYFLRLLARRVDIAERELVENTTRRDKYAREVATIRKQERAIEDMFVTDVKAKLTRLLNECDLLIIPRMTIINATIGFTLPAKLHDMAAIQAEVIKDFMKQGKPVLVCAGPTNEPGQTARPESPDELEKLLLERGIELGGQTILFDSESSAFRAQLAGKSFGGAVIPPLSFEPLELPPGKVINPLGAVMLAAMHSIDEKLKITPRALRPVYVTREQQNRMPYLAEFVWSAAESWNESRPFFQSVRAVGPDGRPVRAFYIPQFDPISLDDTEKNARDQERRGPFPVGVAFEDYTPRAWDGDAAIRSRSRIAVIGQGGIFSGKTLEPATERLLLNTCNWLTSRDDRLTNTTQPTWKFPRVTMSDAAKQRWHWGTFIGLPALFIWMGLVVLMIRRVR